MTAQPIADAVEDVPLFDDLRESDATYAHTGRARVRLSGSANREVSD